MAEAAQVVSIQSKYKIMEDRLVRAEHGNTSWRASVPVGVPYERVLMPEFWLHIAGPKNMIPGDEIRIIPDDGTYVALLYIRDVGASWGAKVAQVWKVDFDAPLADATNDMPAGFKIEWRGLSEKYVVVRESDSATIISGKKTKTDAQIALLEHVKTLTR